MIDPNNVTKYSRTDDELLEFWLFCLFVRGKNADVQAKKLEAFLERLGGARGLLDKGPDEIHEALRVVGAGQYKTLSQAIHQTIENIKKNEKFLQIATVDDLESIPGVGPKTSRFFILHSRPKARVAVLDTHILKYLSEVLEERVPKSTPTGKKYRALEDAFLFQADFHGIDPAEMDLAIWRASRETHPLNWGYYLEDRKNG